MTTTLSDKDLVFIKEKAIEHWSNIKYDPYHKDDRMDMTVCYVNAMLDFLKEKHNIIIDIGDNNGTDK